MFEDRLVASYVLRQFMLFDEGNTWTAFAQIIAGVIGSGVLSLSWSVAQLGWVAAPISLFLFAFVTLLSAYLLSKLHLYPNPSNGVAIINRTYLQAVENIPGDRAIEQSNCYHEHGHEAAYEYGLKTCMIFFGIVQIIASQIPNFRSTKWLSITAAVMSFAYSLVGSGLGLSQTIGMNDWIPILEIDVRKLEWREQDWAGKQAER